MIRSIVATLALSVLIVALACAEATESGSSAASSGGGSWQSHRYTAKINETLDFQSMDRMTSGDRNSVCNALRTVGYDPNAYLDSALQGQPANESINFRRDFIIGVLLVMATPEGIGGYCR